ncbi:sulfatase [Halostagnicola sp. A56]|nr:sulfatase [Halostagnicola sp. A56]
MSSAHWRLKSLEKSASSLLYGIHPAIGDTLSRTYNALTDRTGSDDEDSVVAEFTDFLDESERFYSLVHLMDTHTPYDVDDELVERYLDTDEYENRPLSALAEEFPTGSITANSLTPGGVVNQDNERWADHEAGVGTALARAQYDAAATEADRTIEGLLEALEDRDLLEETLVVVLADHGESLGEHEIYFEHHGLYEPTTRIPLVVRPPESDAGVERSSELVSITDIAPTILDALDIPDEQAFDADGQSLRPLLEGESDDWERRESLLLEEANTQRFRGVRTDRWKYLRAVEDDPTCRYCERPHGASEQLYDLEADPEETENLAEKRSDTLATLRDELDDLLARYDPQTGPSDDTDGDSVEYDDEEEVLDRLESLGYR